MTIKNPIDEAIVEDTTAALTIEEVADAVSHEFQNLAETVVSADAELNFDGLTPEQIQARLKSQDDLFRQVKSLKDRMKAFEGVDADEYKALKQAAADKELADQIAAGNFEAVLESAKTAHAAREANLIKVIGEQMIDAQAFAAIAAADGNAKLLLPHITPKLSVEETADGKFVLNVEGHASIADLVAATKADRDFGGAFKSSVEAGTNAAATTTSKATTGITQGNPWAPATWNMGTQALIEQTNPGLAAMYKREVTK